MTHQISNICPSMNDTVAQERDCAGWIGMGQAQFVNLR